MHKMMTAVLVFIGLTLTSIPLSAQMNDRDSRDGQTPNLSGVWAQKVVNTSISKIPIVGKVTTVSTAYMLVDIEQDDDDLRLESRVCDLRIDSSQDSVRTVVPASFVGSMGDQTRKARVVQSDGETRFVAPSKTTTLGVQLRNPSYENLPDEPSDPRVVDQDGDGDPGVTLHLRGLVSADLYVAQRGSDTLRGQVRGNSIIDGLVSWTSDQRVLGSTSVFVRSQPESRPHPDQKKSYFRTTRVDSSTSCSDVLSRRNHLFDR